MLYSYRDKEIRVFGLPGFNEEGNLERLSLKMINLIPSLSFLGRRPVGGRLAFRTNSKTIKLNIELETLSIDTGMSLFAAAGSVLYRGNHNTPLFMGIAAPENYQQRKFSRSFKKSGYMEDIMIYLSRNEIIKNLTIELDDDAIIEAPTEYALRRPICYYGSSITEGGCASMVSNAYPAIISRSLDIDYINLGFSGACLGEYQMANYINSLDMSIFVYDYDHNAPTLEYLRNTHEAFFKRIRSAHKNLPIVIISRPSPKYTDEDRKRRKIIKDTYIEALSNGDKNVYFIDGEALYGADNMMFATTDGIHPNDLGFYKMASLIEPVLRKILKKEEL